MKVIERRRLGRKVRKSMKTDIPLNREVEASTGG
jgi:hypothetical protein